MRPSVIIAAVVACLLVVSTISAENNNNNKSTNNNNNKNKNMPLVSVVVPTFERPLFVAHMLELIKQQDYPNLEIIIVDDSPLPSLSQIPEGVQYVHMPNERLSIGEKRNIGSALAKGEVIVHWDDDDYFRAHRISAQVAPILAGEVDMTVLEHHVYFFARAREYFTLQRSSSWGPHFGTFVYSRRLWDAGLRYPDNSMAEDYAYAEQGLNNGFTIRTLNNEDGKHIYVRHTNTWDIDFADYVSQTRQIERPAFFSAQEEGFYHDAAEATERSSLPPNMFPSELIKWDRREFVPAWVDEAAIMATPNYKYLHGETPGEGGLPISWPITAVIIGVLLAGIAAIIWRERRSLRYTTVGDKYASGQGINLDDRMKGYGSV